jgi:hypothetical protein
MRQLPFQVSLYGSPVGAALPHLGGLSDTNFGGVDRGDVYL